MVRKGVNKPSTLREVAAKAGVSHVLVDRKLKQGKSEAQIIEEANVRRQKQAEKPAKVTDKTESFAEAQARKETALANLRELELAEKRAELISAADVKTAWAAHIAGCKNKLISMADELMDKIAVESSAVKCRQMILDRVRTALAELSTDSSGV